MKHLFYKISFLLAVGLLSLNQGAAQSCTVPGFTITPTSFLIWGAPFPDIGGQTFIACQTGVITSITMEFSSGNPGDPSAQFFIENGQGDGIILTDELVQNSNIPAGGGPFTITPTTPFPVVNGQTYIFGFISSQAISFLSNNANPYPDGFARDVNDDFNLTALDFVFSVVIEPNTNIPTLSQWGLIILGLLILNIGSIFIYRQKLAFAGEQTMAFSFSTLPFDKASFFQYFGLALILLIVGGIMSVVFLGYELLPFDVAGSLLTAGFVAYLIQLIRMK